MFEISALYLLAIQLFGQFSTSFGDGCGDGSFQTVRDPTKCITPILKPASYVDALQTCQTLGGSSGSLVSIHSVFENVQFATIGKDADPKCSFWIGLQNFDHINFYAWADETTVDYYAWPSGYAPLLNESCGAYISPTDRVHWIVTSDIFDKKCFLCERQMSCPADWVYYNGSCYLFKAQEMEFFDADNFCIQNGGRLTSVLSQQEQMFLDAQQYTHFMGNQYYIGLHQASRSSPWVWTDGSPLLYQNWYKYAQFQTDRNCASVVPEDVETWVPNACHEKYYVVCKKRAM